MTSWVPIFPPSSPHAASAWEVIDGVSEALLKERDHLNSLLFGYIARARDSERWSDSALAYLNAAIDRAPEELTRLSLYGGVAGLGWTMEHIARLLSDTSEGDANEDIDTLLLQRLQNGRWQDDYDLIGGLVGFGVYFLERLPAKTALSGIRLLIDQLAESAEHTPSGVTWRTAPQLLPTWQRQLCPDGYYNLGVAHGVPGVIHFLSEALAAGTEEERARPLLEGAMRWLVAQERPPGSLSRFGGWVAPGRSSDSRLAWCYGDLGILSVLLQAASQSGRIDWKEYALSLLEHCLARPVDETGVGDATLCHGAMGVAHIFNRIYQHTADQRCLQAAVAWFERALGMRRPGVAGSGFLTATRADPSSPETWESDLSFLTGDLGIALALLAALTPVEPNWDRLLLLSGRGSHQHRRETAWQ